MAYELVPIRLELGPHRDTLCWNVHESDEALDDFCRAYCLDAGLPEPQALAQEMAVQVKRQLQHAWPTLELTNTRVAAGNERLEIIKCVALRCVFVVWAGPCDGGARPRRQGSASRWAPNTR